MPQKLIWRGVERPFRGRRLPDTGQARDGAQRVEISEVVSGGNRTGWTSAGRGGDERGSVLPIPLPSQRFGVVAKVRAGDETKKPPGEGRLSVGQNVELDQAASANALRTFAAMPVGRHISTNVGSDGLSWWKSIQ